MPLHARTHRRTAACSAALLALCAGLAVSPASAQPSVDALTVEAPAFAGESFEGVDLPVTPRDGMIEMGAARVWAWATGPTRRLLLDRDARVVLGPFEFHADRASVWIEPIRVTDPGNPNPLARGEREAYQVAAYFDRVRTPAGQPGIAQAGERLLVTGIIVGPPPTLTADRLRNQAAPRTRFVQDSEARLARHLGLITGEKQAATPQAPPVVFELPTPVGTDPVQVALAPALQDQPLRVEADGMLVEGEGDALVRTGRRTTPRPDLQPQRVVDTRAEIPAYTRTAPVAPPRRRISFNAPEIASMTDEGERAVVMSGGVAFTATPANPLAERALQLTATRAVVFLNEDAPDAAAANLDANSIAGIYMEGDVVATDGAYTLRGGQVYYNPQTDEAVVLDAVFWTVDERRGMPLYMRAGEIRQLSLSAWSATDVTLSNVAFAEPHFAIGATDVTITVPTRAPGGDASATGSPSVSASNVSFRAGGAAMISVPSVTGEVRQSPLREVRYDNVAGDNAVRTKWDIYALAGIDAPAGSRADLLVDAYTERGPALGFDLSWDRPGINGGVFGYLIFDNGTDELSSGADIDRDDEFRGVLTAENIWRVTDDWTLFLEGSYISDAAFIDAFFDREAETRREFTNSLYARRLRANELLSFEVRGSLNDFVANEDILQSVGAQTERLPELRYARVAEDIGPLSYTANARAGMVRFNFDEVEARERGLDTNRRSRAGLGIRPGDSVADRLQLAGLDQGEVLRFDTRHELELPLNVGPFSVVPFAVGRFTAYDNEFDSFRGAGDSDEEAYRLWSALGTRISTSIVKVDAAVQSRAFDLNGIRHIIEPSVTAWQGASTIDPALLPVYDNSVESLADGTVVRAGARQTWQTKRGGDFAEEGVYTVDWITLDTNYVWSSDDAPVDSPYGLFYEARPELSNLGEHVQADLVWLATNALAVTSDVLYDVENERLARFAAGLSLDHGPGLSSFMQYREIDVLDGTRLRAGTRYELTRKYAFELSSTWNLDDDSFQRVGLDIERRFPQWTVTFALDVDNTSDNLSFGISARPVGIGGAGRARLFTDPENLTTPVRTAASLRRSSSVGGPFDAR